MLTVRPIVISDEKIIEISDHAPYLPKECKFRVSDLLKAKILSTNWVDSADKDEMRIKMNLYPRDFIGGDYRVISTTNFAELEIPLEFECKHFMLNRVLGCQHHKGLLQGKGLAADRNLMLLAEIGARLEKDKRLPWDIYSIGAKR